MAEEKNELAAAENSIELARQLIERQKQLIANLDEAGADTLSARLILEAYETNLRIFEGHRDYLRRRQEGP
jgi:hypothetical protein